MYMYPETKCSGPTFIKNFSDKFYHVHSIRLIKQGDFFYMRDQFMRY